MPPVAPTEPSSTGKPLPLLCFEIVAESLRYWPQNTVPKKKNNKKKKSTKSLRTNGEATKTQDGGKEVPAENGDDDGVEDLESEVVRVTPVHLLTAGSDSNDRCRIPPVTLNSRNHQNCTQMVINQILRAMAMRLNLHCLPKQRRKILRGRITKPVYQIRAVDWKQCHENGRLCVQRSSNWGNP